MLGRIASKYENQASTLVGLLEHILKFAFAFTLGLEVNFAEVKNVLSVRGRKMLFSQQQRPHLLNNTSTIE
jgi:uncharacterized membrane protein YqgA involved in biofilm formation